MMLGWVRLPVKEGELYLFPQYGLMLYTKDPNEAECVLSHVAGTDESYTRLTCSIFSAMRLITGV